MMKFSSILRVVTNKFYPMLVFLIVVYALAAYIFLSILSYFAMTYYTQGCPCDENDLGGGSSNNYGNNYGTVEEDETKKFTPFGGQGTRLG